MTRTAEARTESFDPGRSAKLEERSPISELRVGRPGHSVRSCQRGATLDAFWYFGPMLRVVAALFERDGRVLVAQRPVGKARAHRWELPGGKVEAGEGDVEALVRECLEELTVEVSVVELVGSVKYAYEDLTIELVLYRARLPAGAQLRAADAHALAWIPLESLADLDLCDADRQLLPAIMNGRSRTS